MRKLFTLMFTFLFLFSSFSSNAKESTITQSLGFEPTSLDPVYATKVTDIEFIVNLFEGLMTFDKRGEITYGQAKSYSVSDDGKVYTFTLRDDIYWSDGKPVVAQDFYHAMSRHFDESIDQFSKPTYLFFPIKNGKKVFEKKLPFSELGVKVIDDKNIQYTLNQAIPYFLSIVTANAYLPIPSHAVKKLGNKWAEKNQPLISNAAYTYQQHIDKNTILAKKSKFYYDHKNVYYDNLITRVIPKRDEALYQFRNKKVDFIREYRGKLIDWEESTLGAHFIHIGMKGTTYLALNNKLKKLQDKRVRNALSLALFRDDITSRIPGVNIIPAYTFAADSTPSKWNRFQPKWSQWTKEKRLEKAKELMTLAGYSQSNPLTLEISTNSAGLNELFVNAVKSLWKNIYVEAKVLPKTGKDHYVDLARGNYEVARAKWVADYDDPSNFLGLLRSKGIKNYANWSNANYDELLNKLSNTRDLKKRNVLFAQLENSILENTPIIPAFTEQRQSILRNNISLYSKASPESIAIKHFYPVEKLSKK